MEKGREYDHDHEHYSGGTSGLLDMIKKSEGIRGGLLDIHKSIHMWSFHIITYTRLKD